MPYVHTNKSPVVCFNDPVDPDSTDWIYFTYQDWLRENETITTHSAIIVGGVIAIDSTSVGTVADEEGNNYANSYGVKFSIVTGSTDVSITHRVSTTVAGSPDLGRTSIDHTAIIPVVDL